MALGHATQRHPPPPQFFTVTLTLLSRGDRGEQLHTTVPFLLSVVTVQPAGQELSFLEQFPKYLLLEAAFHRYFVTETKAPLTKVPRPDLSWVDDVS